MRISRTCPFSAPWPAGTTTLGWTGPSQAALINLLADKGFAGFTRMDMPEVVYEQARGSAVSSSRRLYLSEVVKAVRTYHDRTREIARKISTLGAMERLASDEKNSGALGSVQKRIAQVRKEIPREDCRLVDLLGAISPGGTGRRRSPTRSATGRSRCRSCESLWRAFPSPR